MAHVWGKEETELGLLYSDMFRSFRFFFPQRIAQFTAKAVYCVCCLRHLLLTCKDIWHTNFICTLFIIHRIRSDSPPAPLNFLNCVMMKLFHDAVYCTNCIEIQVILVRFPTVSSPEYPSGDRLLFIRGEATGT